MVFYLRVHLSVKESNIISVVVFGVLSRMILLDIVLWSILFFVLDLRGGGGGGVFGLTISPDSSLKIVIIKIVKANYLS